METGKLRDCASSTAAGAPHIALDYFDNPTKNVLRKYNSNDDGKVDAANIQAVVSTLIAEKYKSKVFKLGMLTFLAFTAVLLAATCGLTWAVVAALKDTRVQGGVLVSNDASRAAVMTASTELLVHRGRLVERGPDGANTGNVLSTAAYMGRAALSPDMPVSALMGVQTLVLTTPSGDDLSLTVLAFARVTSAATGKHVLKLQTPAGLLVVEEDGSLAVQGEPGQLLRDAGFNAGPGPASSSHRRLLEATGYYIYCSTQDCASWTPDKRSACGGDTGVSCAGVAADGDALRIERSSANRALLANIGYTGSCGSGTIISSSSCLYAAELCYNNGNPLYTAAPLSAIATNNYKCRQTECKNGAIWGWNSNVQYQFQSGTTGTVSFCAGTKIWNFCC